MENPDSTTSNSKECTTSHNSKSKVMALRGWSIHCLDMLRKDLGISAFPVVGLDLCTSPVDYLWVDFSSFSTSRKYPGTEKECSSSLWLFLRLRHIFSPGLSVYFLLPAWKVKSRKRKNGFVVFVSVLILLSHNLWLEYLVVDILLP